MRKFFEEQKKNTEKFLNEQGKSREEIEKRRDAQIEDMKRMISIFTKTVSGTKTRGMTGEFLLKEALKESIKVGLIKTNLKTEGGEVEFAWDLGDGKYIPIDSKFPDVFQLLEEYDKVESSKERDKLKKEIIDKVKKEIQRVQKYQNLFNTIDSCILVVPEAILEIAPELVGLGRENNVFLCSYKDVFVIAHTLQDKYIKLKEEGDIGKYKQMVSLLFQIIENINSKVSTIDKALTTIANANTFIKDYINKAKEAGSSNNIN
ncbi:MAG: recombination protein RmuC [Thermosipho sp. (in: thermotogales)]|jgi:DNA recombination protein RmuC|nr:recombination protein RmuC [Thermosipho sp. (in: thermotogales)]